MEREFERGLVSVITPIYNAEAYIEETLASVLSQDYEKIEIVLVDDCSQDTSPDRIKKWQAEHGQIVYFRQPTNQGAGAARNKALELARGQYVAFLDSDDLWLPGKLRRQISLMQESGSPLCYTAIEMMDGAGTVTKSKRKLKTTCDYRTLLHNTVIATSSVVVDRMALGDFRMPLRRGGQDYATWLRLLRGGAVARGIDEALVRYRVAAGSLSSNKFKSIQQVWEIQTQDEGIGRLAAAYHVLCFTCHALKKYLF